MKLFNPKETPELDRLRIENEELKNTLHEILSRQNESADLENEIFEMTGKLSELAKEEQRIEDFVKTANNEKLNKSKSIFDLNKKISRLAQEKEQIEESIISLQNKSNSALQQEEKNKANLSKLNSTIESKEKELSDLTIELDKLNGTANRLKDEITRQEDRVGGLKETSSDLTDQIKESKKSVLKFEKEIEEKEKLKDKIDVDTETIELSFEILEEKRIMILDEISDLESKIEKIDEEHTTVAEQLKNDQQTRHSMQTSIAELIQSLNEKEKTFKEFAITKDKYVDDISQKRNELDNVTFEIKNKKETISELEEEIKIFDIQKNEIELSIEKKRSIVEDVERNLIRKKEEESSFDDQLTELKNNILDFEEKKFKVEENILQLENSFAETTKAFTDEINESKSKLTSIKQLIIEKDREFNLKETTLLERNTQLAEYTGIVRLLRKEKESVEIQLQDLKKTKDRLSDKIISLKEEESKGKTTINQYKLEINDLIKKRESISYELNSLLDNSNNNYSEYNEKNKLLIHEINYHEKIISTLSEKTDKLEVALSKINEDVTKADLEKEERSTNIAQLITMEKTFKEKVETYKKELERIEEETFIETPEPKINLEVKKIDNEKIKLENNN